MSHICEIDHQLTEKLIKATSQAGKTWLVLEHYKLCSVHKNELLRRNMEVSVLPGGARHRWVVAWDICQGNEFIDLDAEETASASDE